MCVRKRGHDMIGSGTGPGTVCCLSRNLVLEDKIVQ